VFILTHTEQVALCCVPWHQHQFLVEMNECITDERDPGLNHGYAYVVEHEKFEKYLDDYGPRIPDDKSSCNNHDMIKSASMRGGKGMAASGLGTVECSCHDMKQLTAVGDLQKGEQSVWSWLVVALTTNYSLR
jgi:hypothetical protein